MDEKTPKKRRQSTKPPKGRAGTPSRESTEPLPSPKLASASLPGGDGSGDTHNRERDSVNQSSVEELIPGNAENEAKDKEEDAEADDDIEDEILHPRKHMDAEVERALLATFTPEQQQRYEVFRRAHFQKGAMKKVLQTVLGQNVTESSAIVVAGAAKLFVGEMTEKAREIMEERKESGPIRPEHLREAYRRHKHEPSAFKPPKFRERRFV